MRLRFLLAFLLLPLLGLAQPAPLPLPRNFQPLFEKGTRSATGQPGPHYWQNTADYDLAVSFDPTTRRVAGTADIRYVNNSPDALAQLWFKLYPNLYQKGAAPQPKPSPRRTLSDGVKIFNLNINGEDLRRAASWPAACHQPARDAAPAPSRPHQVATVRATWNAYIAE